MAESAPEIATDSQGHRFRLEPWSCPICKKSDEKVLGPRGGRHHRYGWGITSTIVQCRDCSLLYPNPFPIPLNPQELYGDPEAYFVRHDEQAKIERSREFVRAIASRLGKRSYRLLDVGSGRGELLHAAQLEGVEAVGLEFSDAMIAHCRKAYGITPIAQPVERFAEESAQRFDAVSLSGILEHVYDPDAMIAAVAKLSAPGAIVYIDVPNEPSLMTMAGNLFNRLRGDSAVYNLSPSWSPYHVYGFNPKALDRLLGKHGLEVVERKIFAAPYIPSRPQLKDRVMAFCAGQIIRASNWIGMSSNMETWAKKSGPTP